MESLITFISTGKTVYETTQLSHDLSRLRSSLPKAHIVINRAEWGRFKDKNLALLLSRLKDTTCDAEDLLREFDDQELRQRMEDRDRNIAGQLVSSSLNLAKCIFSGSKTRLKEAQSMLDMVVDHTEAALNLMGLSVEPVQLGKPLMPVTSSVISVPQVYGRNEERDLVIERLGVTIGRDNERDHAIKLLGVPLTRSAKAAGRKGGAICMGEVASTSRAAKRLKGKSSKGISTETNNCCTGNVSVLPIVGIGGVGKTTLAQFIYNDRRVKSHFDLRLWVCVSDIFDKRRITKEIMESITGEEFKCSGSLDALHVELKELLLSQKILLVMDDVWPIAKSEWEAFFAPFRNVLDGSMILLTTRYPKVAYLVSTVKPIELEGLPADIFQEFFNKCAFGEQDPESHTQLKDIGQNIADRLCGSPLAAKTLGRLLNMDLTLQHWRSIQNSELWQLPHEENEILPALQLSYLYIPWELKRCFAVCSMFPKDYSFEAEELVAFWVTHCFVASEGRKRLEDLGHRYLDDLRSRFLFQTDPKFPKQSRYVMHDLIHDMAQSVSVDECFLMQGLSYQHQGRISKTVRHMSIDVDNEALSRIGGIQHLIKLQSLRFGIGCEVEVSLFKHLSNILFLSLKGCKLVKLPECICELKRLRCLDISDSSIQELPGNFWCLYSLQYLYANRLKAVHQDVTNLVNLRRLQLAPAASLKLSRIKGLGTLSSLQNLEKFTVGFENGRSIGELNGMNQLSGKLHICSLVYVQSMEEAAEARLVDKQYLKELTLKFQLSACVFGSNDDVVLEGLCPPSSIESLEILNFGSASISLSWLKQETLPSLRTLNITNARYIREFVLQRRTSHEVQEPTTSADGTLGCSIGVDSTQPPGVNNTNYNGCRLFTSLTFLQLYSCDRLENLDQFLSPEYFPSIQSIHIISCRCLQSLPVHNFGGFASLQDLWIHDCTSLVCPREMVLPPSVQQIYVSAAGKLDKSFPGCLENLASLNVLYLLWCTSMESIQLNSINTKNLKCLVLSHCPKLLSIGGSHALSSIKHVDISDCGKLTEVEQPLLKKGLRSEELKQLKELESLRYSLFFL